MRPGWYPILVVVISLIILSGVTPLVQAQTEVPVIQIVAGNQNPTGTMEISGSIQDLSSLQFVLTAESELVRVDRITVGFGRSDRDDTLGNMMFLDSLQARLIHDANANGTFDAGETVLGTQSLEELEDPASVTFALSPALDLATGVPTTLLTIIDINAPSQSMQMTPSSRWYASWGLISLLLIGLIMGVAGGSARASRGPRYYLPWLLVVLLWSIILPGCDEGDDEDNLSFIVNLPSNGVTRQNVRLGPADAISGLTVRLIE